ncbi:TIGR04338 family metallohydrolase [Nocardia sp. CA-128927]|uniref:TIGR04338 family metallohydrolase n=1 Tax=Nocardia sp. CA-128927 TaxID=3239975 RepID=UPI003D9696ED
MTRVVLRDIHRSRVYRAEQRLWNLLDDADYTGERTVELLSTRICLPVEKRMASIDAVAAYLDGVLALRAVRRSYSRAGLPLTVRARRGARAHGHYEPTTATIAISMHDPHAVRELLLLHELAHHLQPAVSVAHGPEFCRAYSDLIHHVISPDIARLLRAYFTDEGARCR